MALCERKGFVCFVSFCSRINKFMVELAKRKELLLMINMDMDTKKKIIIIKKAVLIDIFSVTEHEFQVHSFHV